eukprot:403349386
MDIPDQKSSGLQKAITNAKSLVFGDQSKKNAEKQSQQQQRSSRYFEQQHEQEQIDQFDDFQQHYALPQVRRTMQDRDIPMSKKRTYGQQESSSAMFQNKFSFGGGDTRYRRIPSPIYKSDIPYDYEMYGQDDSQKEGKSIARATFDALSSFQCPPLSSLKCNGLNLKQTKSRKDEKPSDNLLEQVQSQEPLHISSNFDYSVYNQIMNSKKTTQAYIQEQSTLDPSIMQMKQFEKEEDEIVRIRESIKIREIQNHEFQAGIQRLKQQIEDEIKLGYEMRKYQQTQQLDLMSFYEMQPHLIYQQTQNQKEQSNPNLNILNIFEEDKDELDNQYGVIPEVELMYSFRGSELRVQHIQQKGLWKSLILDQSQQIRSVKYAYIESSKQHYILIVTKEEIFVVQYLFDTQTNQIILEHRNKDQKIIHQNQTERCEIFQSKATGRIFYGDKSAQILEIILESPQPQKKTSFISCLSMNKMSKPSKEAPKTSKSYLDKIKTFFTSGFTQTHQVTGFCEHESSNTLFVIVKNLIYTSQSYIDVYSQGPQGNEIKHLFKISLEKIYNDIQEKVNIPTSTEILDQVEILKIWISENNYECQNQFLNILLTSGLRIALVLNFKELVLTEAEKEERDKYSAVIKTLQISEEFQILNYKHLPFNKLITEYLGLFDMLEQQTLSSYVWKPLIADPIALSQKNDLGYDKNIQILDHQQHPKTNQDFYLISFETLIDANAQAFQNRNSYYPDYRNEDESQNNQIPEFQNESFQNQTKVLYFIVCMQPNYRRQRGMRHTQDLAGIIQICDKLLPIKLQLNLNRHQSLNLHRINSLSVLTATGSITDFVIPSKSDVLATYIRIISEFDKLQHTVNRLPHSQQHNENPLTFIRQDFQTYIQGQDLQETLQILLSITFANENDDLFCQSSLVDYFYKNLGKMMQNYRVNDMNESKYEAQPGISRALTQMIANNKQLESTGTMTAITKDMRDMAADLFISMTQSDNAAQFDTLILENEPYYNFWKELIPISRFIQNDNFVKELQSKTELESSEYLRITSIYHYLYMAMSDILERNIFTLTSGKNNEKIAEPNIIPQQLTDICQLIRRVELFIRDSKNSIVNITESQVIDDGQQFAIQQLQTEALYQGIKKEVSYLQRVLDRFYDGLTHLSAMFKSDKLSKILKDNYKGDEQKSLCQICLIEYIEVGLSHYQIGQLMEAFITQSLDSAELLRVNSFQQLIRKQANSFIHESAFNLIFGKKLLAEALVLKNKQARESKSIYGYKKEQEQQSSLQSLLNVFSSTSTASTSALQMNLSIALTDLARNQMWVEMVQLCVRRFDQMERMQQVLIFKHKSNAPTSGNLEHQESQGNPNEGSGDVFTSVKEQQQMEWLELIDEKERSRRIKNMEYDKQECIIILFEVIEEILKRIKQLEKKKKQTISDDYTNKEEEKQVQEQSRFNAIIELVRYLNQHKSVEELNSLKMHVLAEILMVSNSELLHTQIYDFLLKSDQLDVLTHFNTPFANDFIQKVNSYDISDVQYFEGSKQYSSQQQQPTLIQQSNLLSHKLTVNYQNKKNAQIYGELYKYIMEEVCSNQQSILNIKERIKWVNKAEGCLIQHRELLGIEKYQKGVGKFQNDEFSQQLIEHYETFKDYFLIISQMCDKIQTLINKKKRKLNLGEYSDIQGGENNQGSRQRSKSLLGKIFSSRHQNNNESDEEDINQSDPSKMSAKTRLKHDIQDLELVLESLTYRIIDVNEVYETAIKTKCWQEYLNILRLTEVKDQFYSKPEQASTQARIEYLYQAIINKYYNYDKLPEISQKNLKFSKFTSILDSLRLMSGGKLFTVGMGSLNYSSKFESSFQNVEIFPIKFIFTQIEEINMEYLANNRELLQKSLQNIINVGDIKQSYTWTPFWHIQYLYKHSDENNMLGAFEIFSDQKSLNVSFLQWFRQSRGQQLVQMPPLIPESYLSIAYIIILWHSKFRPIINIEDPSKQDQMFKPTPLSQLSKNKASYQNPFKIDQDTLNKQQQSDSNQNIVYSILNQQRDMFRQHKSEMSEVMDRLRESIVDQLVFAKAYISDIKKIIEKVEEAIQNV